MLTEPKPPKSFPVSKKRVRRPKSPFSKELIDELFSLSAGGEGLKGPDGLLSQLTAALVNRALDAEMSSHLGYSHKQTPPEEQNNRRNGHRSKSVRTSRGVIDVVVPRDREGSFKPVLIGKHQRQFDGFDDKILSLYARGMTTRDIQAHLGELYGVEVSPDLISRVTDSIVDEIQEWQSRPLESVYPIVYIDALFVKIRDQGTVAKRAVHIAVGVNAEGERDVLGLWIEKTEGAKFWSSVLASLRQRGVEDILILCADGLTGLDSAVEANFPKAIFQTCLVHMVRNSTRHVSYKDLKLLCADLKTIYTAANAEEAEEALAKMARQWGQQYPQVIKAWVDRRDEWMPFLAFPPELRRVVYTTNAIEALNRMLRKALKTRGALPSDEAVEKLLFLAIQNARKTWGRRNREWLLARRQLDIHFEGRLPLV